MQHSMIMENKLWHWTFSENVVGPLTDITEIVHGGKVYE